LRDSFSVETLPRVVAQLGDLKGSQTAGVLQNAVASGSGTSSGIIATTIGIVTLMVTINRGEGAA
jgi:hypothetical protein